jgi:hypothetical protein
MKLQRISAANGPLDRLDNALVLPGRGERLLFRQQRDQRDADG